jgi:hypothetical protein
MSKTYKTDPAWVKLRRNTRGRIEKHNHEDGTCNFDEWVNNPGKTFSYWPRKCGYTVSYYGWHGGFFARPPHGREYRRLFEGSIRTGWRKARQDMLKLSREDIEDYDVKSYQHRHSALWELY